MLYSSAGDGRGSSSHDPHDHEPSDQPPCPASGPGYRTPAGRSAMRPFMIMGLVLVEVTLWQWRVAVTGRNQFLAARCSVGSGPSSRSQ